LEKTHNQEQGVVPCYQDEFHPDALQDFAVQQRAGRYHALGQLLALIDEVIEHGLGSGEQPVHPVTVVNGYGLYERCAPRMFGVFSIGAPPTPGQLPVLRLLAIDTTAQAARTTAAARRRTSMGKLTELRNELMHNPEFRAGYEQQGQLVRFGRMMRGARESQGLTQAELASRLDISQSEISRLEKGEGVNGPTFERIVAFAHALGLQLVVGFADEQPADGPGNARAGQGGAATGRPARPPRFAGFKRRQRTRASDAATQDEPEMLWSAF
jgi:transcriptional regulator with XRE-family HTH domain